MLPTKVILCLIGITTLVTAGIQEGEINGELGNGYHFDFDPELGLMSHTGDAADPHPYNGGTPDCCSLCRKANDPARWGNTDLFNYKWDRKYNTFNRCTCFRGPRTPEGRARLKTREHGPIIGYCGNNQTFLNQVDGTFGVDRTFYYQSVEDEVIWGSFSDKIEGSEECCQRCSEKYPEYSQMFGFDRYSKKCRCYKTIPGKRPETFAEGSFSGVCAN